MIQNIDRGAGATTDPTPPKKSGCWLYAILGVGGVVLLIGLLLPAVRNARPAAYRAQCVNNLRQIGLVLHTYHDAFGAFPPTYTVDADGKPLHSWRTLLLPFCEGAELFKSLDLSKPWDDPANAELFEQFLKQPGPAAFRCPVADLPRGQTTYLAIVTPNSCLRPGEGRTLSDIKDGQSNTLVVIEVPDAHAVPWMAPVDADEALVMSLDSKADLVHNGGMNALFCDGSVRFLRADLSAKKRQALISIAGDDVAAGNIDD